ncbi:MAG: tetratricopeptide repeat protein [Sulfuricurvum sp.]
MRVVLAIILLSAFLRAEEPSAFGAGDLNNPNPYGLTREEKLFLENKKEIQGIASKSSLQNAKVESVAERLDGIQAIIEGLAQAQNEQKLLLKKVTDSLSDQNRSQKIDTLINQNNTDGENIIRLKLLIEELSQSVDGINNAYISKEEFATLMKQLKVAIPASSNSKAVISSEKAKKVDNVSLEKEGKRLLGQKNYPQAQEAFEAMIQKKYKSAEANFWIGEIYFDQQQYKEAMGYYKQSASENEKTVVMPTLLLHSGIALEKMGDVAKARDFYGATVARYAGSGAAMEASKRLSKLK